MNGFTVSELEDIGFQMGEEIMFYNVNKDVTITYDTILKHFHLNLGSLEDERSSSIEILINKIDELQKFIKNLNYLKDKNGSN